MTSLLRKNYSFPESFIGGFVFFFNVGRNCLCIPAWRRPDERTNHVRPRCYTGRAGRNSKKAMVEVLPSILSADFAHLADQVAAAERGGCTMVHVDVMDGHFVPNITIGPVVVKSLRQATKLPLDCHLMIENPDEFIPAFAEAGADWVSVHYEACRHLHRSLGLIAHYGMKPGVVVNPATRVDLLTEILPMVHFVLVMSVNPGFGGQKFIEFSLDKIRRLVQLRQEMGLAFRIEVDGGVSRDTVARVVQAGAELLVAGNAIFGAGQPDENARVLLAAARKAAGE
jgi:ribulose-phosphate 3-epimerase